MADVPAHCQPFPYHREITMRCAHILVCVCVTLSFIFNLCAQCHIVDDYANNGHKRLKGDPILSVLLIRKGVHEPNTRCISFIFINYSIPCPYFFAFVDFGLFSIEMLFTRIKKQERTKFTLVRKARSLRFCCFSLNFCCFLLNFCCFSCSKMLIWCFKMDLLMHLQSVKRFHHKNYFSNLLLCIMR